MSLTYTRAEIENTITELQASIEFRRSLYLKEGCDYVRTMINEAITRKDYLLSLIADSTVQTVEL